MYMGVSTLETCISCCSTPLLYIRNNSIVLELEATINANVPNILLAAGNNAVQTESEFLDLDGL